MLESKCPSCGKGKFKVQMEIGDKGDVEETVCVCGYILKREVIVERPDGTKQRRPLRVSQDEQPEIVTPTVVQKETEFSIPSASEMTLRAVKAKKDTIGKQARILITQALKEAAKPDNVVKGCYSFLVKEDIDYPTTIIKEIVKELRERGYKPTRQAEPGVGTWIQIKWATSMKKKKTTVPAPTKPDAPDQRLSFKKKHKEVAKKRLNTLRKNSTSPK